MPARSLTNSQVVVALEIAGVYRPTWTLADAVYTTLDRAQVRDEYWPGWLDSLPNALVEIVPVGGGKSARQPRGLPEVFDCDDLADDFRAYVVRCCAVWAVKDMAQRGGTPFGPMSYLIAGKPDGGHDCVAFIDHDLAVHWFEPQTGEFLTPSEIEVASVWRGDFR